VAGELDGSACVNSLWKKPSTHSPRLASPTERGVAMEPRQTPPAGLTFQYRRQRNGAPRPGPAVLDQGAYAEARAPRQLRTPAAMRVEFSIQRLAVRRLRKEHRPDAGRHPPRCHLWRPHHNRLGQISRAIPKPQATSHRSQKFHADRPARIEVGAPPCGFAVRLVYGCKRDPLGPRTEIAALS